MAKDGRPRVVVPMGLDPLPYLQVGTGARRYAVRETEHCIFYPREGYNRNEEDYENAEENR